MDNRDKTLLMMALMAGIILYAGRAHAMAASPMVAQAVPSAAKASAKRGESFQVETPVLRDAVGRATRVAPQQEFSSGAPDFAMLQFARDRLASEFAGYPERTLHGCAPRTWAPETRNALVTLAPPRPSLPRIL